MGKKRVIASVAVLIVAFFFSLSACDTSEDKDPYLILNVNLDELLYPVSAANKLYLVFYLHDNWTGPWFTLSTTSLTFLTPELRIGQIPFYMEVFYDADGDGQPSTGDIYQGWNRKIDRTADTLNKVILPKTELMILNIDLDNHGTIP